MRQDCHRSILQSCLVCVDHQLLYDALQKRLKRSRKIVKSQAERFLDEKYQYVS